MQQLKKLAVGVLITLGSTGIAVASSNPVIPQLLQNLQAEGGQLHKIFQVSEHINGFAMTLGNEDLIIYASADGQHLFQGNLIDNNARNLTEAYADRHLPKPDFSTAIPLFEDGKWFETHDAEGDTTLYVIHDPRCPYCVRSMDMIMERQYEKGVKVRWVPVAALGKESLQMASVMLASEDPIKFQTDVNRGHKPTARELQAGAPFEQDVMNNSNLMRSIKATGTPAYLVVNEKEGTAHVIHGFRPNDVARAWR